MSPTTEELNRLVQDQRSHIDRLEERVKAAYLRIDEQKKLSDSVYSLALSVERLTISQKNTAEQLTRLRSDVDNIKSRPAKHWDLILSTGIGAMTGYFISMLLGNL